MYEVVEYGRFRQDTDVRFRVIPVKVRGEDQDLTEPGWTVFLMLRNVKNPSATVYVRLIQSELVDSRVAGYLTRADTVAMQDGLWECDLVVTGPVADSAIFGGTRRTGSLKMHVTVEPRITIVPAA
jgi:hypothetical protein